GITTLVDSVPVNGEWLQLSLPAPIVLTSFDISCTTLSRFVKDFVLVASNDYGTTFTNIISSTMIWGTESTQTINVSVPKNTKAFNTYRLIVKSLVGNVTYCTVNKLVFNGTPVSMDVKGAISTNKVIADELVCNKISGEALGGLNIQDEVVGTVTYPDVPMTAATTASYTATASTTLSASWTPWKLYNGYAGNDSNTWFSSSGGRYSGATPSVYTGSVSTIVDGAAVL
ncbi:hypothetical protein HDU85_002389, partial [Gaertneriomyces sp. JEL0708]